MMRELDADIRDKEEADRAMAHQLVCEARLNAKKLAEHEALEKEKSRLDDLRVREADRLCELARKEALELEENRRQCWRQKRLRQGLVSG